MKRLFLFLMMFATCFTMANAQDKAGVTTIYPRFGAVFSKFGGDHIYYGDGMDDRVDSRMKTGFTAGVEVQHMFNDIFGASIGALYSQQGTKYEEIPMEELEHLSIDLDYINIPVLFVATTNVGVSLKAGVQPEIRLGSKFDQVMKRVALSIPIGLSYEYKHFAVDLRYNIGMTGMWNHDSSVKNRTIMLTLGYGIDL